MSPAATSTTDIPPAVKPRTRRRRSTRRLSGMGWAGAIMLAILVLSAIFAPLVTAHGPSTTSGQPFGRAGGSHLLGTDDLGRDLFAQLVYGARVSLVIGVGAALIAVAVGTTIALIAGFYRGLAETILMRTVDLMLAFPFIVIVVVLAAYFGRGLLVTIGVIAGVIWARPARVLRSQVIKVRELDHVVAARAMGASGPRIIGRHVLPRIAPLAAAQFVRAATVAVLIEASLSFLGLGDPYRVSWGTTLYFAQVRNAFLTDAWMRWILPPGLALTVAILAFAFLGQALEQWADPRLARRAPPRGTGRGRHRRVQTVDRAGGAAPVPSGPVLEVRDLSVSYRDRDRPLVAVDGVSLTVGRGSIVGVVGESGSGKTSLVMAVMGLLRAPGRVDGGTVLIEGSDLRLPNRALVRELRGRKVALVPQSSMNSLNPAYTILHQVVEAAALVRDPAGARARAHDALSSVGVAAERHGAYPHELSGGMRQRAVIAMALVNEPALLIADEPVTGLDVVTQARILKLLTDLRVRHNMSILLVSHDLPLVSRTADQIVVMYAGRVVEAGPASVVTTAAAHPYTRLLLRAFPPVRGPRVAPVAIPGEPPDLRELPPGCRFNPRCPEMVPDCVATEPELYPQGNTQHQAACLLRAP